MSQDTITRKKNTGEPGNGGEFGRGARDDATIALSAVAHEQPMPAPGAEVEYQGEAATVVHVDHRTAVLKLANGDLALAADKDLGLDKPESTVIVFHEAETEEEDERQKAAAATVPDPVNLPETLRKRRGHVFYPKAEMRKWPSIYATDNLLVGDKKIVAHYFSATDDHYIVEVDHETGEAFGYTTSYGQHRGEWGYIHLAALEKQTRGPFVNVERDCHFSDRNKRARDILPAEAWAYADNDD